MKITEQQHNEKKEELMKKCFDCYAENGLTGTGIKALAAACGCTTGNLYCYFKNLDELLIRSISSTARNSLRASTKDIPNMQSCLSRRSGFRTR